LSVIRHCDSVFCGSDYLLALGQPRSFSGLIVVRHVGSGREEVRRLARLRFTGIRHVRCPEPHHFTLPQRPRLPLRGRSGRRSAIGIMAYATAIYPIALAGCLLSARTPGLVGGLIERIAMRRIPHPVPTGCRGRARPRGSGKKRLARRGSDGGDRIIGCSYGLAHLRLVSCGQRRRLDAAHLINPIMK